MPNGKHGDNPLSDLTIHRVSAFPEEITELLLEIHQIGQATGTYPLGADWPYSPKEFDWEAGKNLGEARELLKDYLSRLRAGA